MRRVLIPAGLLVLGFACGAPEAPAPSEPAPAQAPAVPTGAPPADGGWVEVPAGKAVLGAQATDPSGPGFDPAAAPEDGPVRQVDVPAFRIATTEVSVAQWQGCVDAGACEADDALGAGPLAPSPDPGLPVVGITAAGAERVCAHLGGRLPTAAEWALAARGAEGRRYPWGPTARCEPMDPAWGSQLRLDATRAVEACADLRTKADTPPDVKALCAVPRGHEPEDVVARLRALRGEPEPAPPACPTPGPRPVQDEERVTHPLGLRWLAGNVREWTSDATDGGRVVVGGSFLAATAADQRLAVTTVLPPELQLPDVGVRCAR